MKSTRKFIFSALAFLMMGSALAVQHQAFSGSGASRTAACQAAVQTAALITQTTPWKRVTRMSPCECSQSSVGWECMVVVTYAD